MAKTSQLRLDTLDLSPRLEAAVYETRLAELQLELRKIQQAYLLGGHNGVVVFEGWDAAGKGGTIRLMAGALDPRSFKVWPIAAPRNYYLQRHFLLRFMERLPPNGAISVFDRSWYGRVLVERVEGLTPKARWKAAYREINDFERMLVDDGVRIAKLFFHISPEVQLARFENRLRDPLKRWKLSYEDFRNRGRWGDYVTAIDAMLDKTSTKVAPWQLIPANDKKFARIAALEHIVARLGAGVSLDPPPMDETVIGAAMDHLEIEPDLVRSLRGRTE
ncbi:MAG: polyphosphate kinase [Limimaricola sp.]|uniref:polyphosphate kinase 2 family protein n=1 Tax=Limimaricola sp. TaxID=2211665 RepID=UPI001DAEFF4C|nr:polyphosphate kinase 2 [Limimaricola sp.]MBI1416281.1 polyphosphate kinase [Limimaricola sp.]